MRRPRRPRNLWRSASVGAGTGATTATLKGGLGSASALTSAGYTIGAIVAVNAVGSALIGSGPHFWAAPFEKDGEFGGLGLPAPWPADALVLRLKGDQPENTTIAVVATDAALDKAQSKRIAVMAQDGMALALRPAHAQTDGDVVFAAATGRHPRPPDRRDLTEIGAVGRDRARPRHRPRPSTRRAPCPLPAHCRAGTTGLSGLKSEQRDEDDLTMRPACGRHLSARFGASNRSTR